MSPSDPPTAAPTAVAVEALPDEVQFAAADAPTAEVDVPVGHAAHALEPGVALYVPAAHMRHDAAPGPAAYVPLLQFRQVLLDVAPTALDHAPAAQGTQVDAPN